MTNYLLEALQRRTVWQKAAVVFGRDPNTWRRDDFGNLICFDEYGNRNSPFGWEFDHIVPVAAGGSDEIENLRPLQWESNVKRN